MDALTPFCPVCEAGDVTCILEISQTLVLNNVLYPTHEEALRAPRGDIRLSFCGTCGHMFNASFDPERVRYGPGYENSLHFSPRFRAYAAEEAHRLIRTYGLRNGHVIDVGCGTGEFLGVMTALGVGRGVGFDPRWTGRAPGDAAPTGVCIVPEPYSETFAGVPADLICCRQVLEHIADPAGFVRGLRKIPDPGYAPVFFFECPDAGYMLRASAFWDVIYEHCGYFGRSSLEWLFNRCGFRILRTGKAFDGQYITLEAAEGRVVDRESGGRSPVFGKLRRRALAFGHTYREAMDAWRLRLARLAEDGRRAAVWGVGAKGVGFLDATSATPSTIRVVDVNPRKHGLYTAGTGLRVGPPSDLAGWQPHLILILNPAYGLEIRRMADDLGLKAELAVVCGAPADAHLPAEPG